MKSTFHHIVRFVVSLLLISTVLPALAQDPHFSQFYEAPLLRNPSLAGIFRGDLRVQGLYRDQWNSFTNAYRTGSLNAEMRHPIGRRNDFVTTALQVVYDKAGDAALTTTQLLPVLNYHKSLNDDRNMYLSLGFMGGWIQKRLDRTKMTTNNQYDGNGYNPSLPDGEPFADFRQGYWDGSVGMSFSSNLRYNENNTFFIGAAYHHFNRPKNSFYQNPSIGLEPKWVFSGGIKLQINEPAFFNIQADYSRQGQGSEVVGGALLGYHLGTDAEAPKYTVYAGAFLRWKDALIPVVKMDFGPMSLSLSYDVNVSSLKTASLGRGGTELSLSWTGFLENRNSSRNDIRCPVF